MALTDRVIYGTAEYFADDSGIGAHDILEFARAIEAAATAPLLERIAELEQRAELAEQAHISAAEERDHLRPLLKKVAELEAKLAQQVPDVWPTN